MVFDRVSFTHLLNPYPSLGLHAELTGFQNFIDGVWREDTGDLGLIAKDIPFT